MYTAAATIRISGIRLTIRAIANGTTMSAIAIAMIAAITLTMIIVLSLSLPCREELFPLDEE